MLVAFILRDVVPFYAKNALHESLPCTKDLPSSDKFGRSISKYSTSSLCLQARNYMFDCMLCFGELDSRLR